MLIEIYKNWYIDPRMFWQVRVNGKCVQIFYDRNEYDELELETHEDAIKHAAVIAKRVNHVLKETKDVD